MAKRRVWGPRQEAQHPRDDRGRFAKKGGQRWQARVVRESGGFANIPASKLEAGPSAVKAAPMARAGALAGFLAPEPAVPRAVKAAKPMARPGALADFMKPPAPKTPTPKTSTRGRTREDVQGELEQARAQLQAAFEYRGGLRGKQAAIRDNGSLRRGAQAAERVRQLEQELAGFDQPKVATSGQGNWTAEKLAGAKFVRTKTGLYEVEKVNKSSVTVKMPPGWDNRVPIRKITEALGEDRQPLGSTGSVDPVKPSGDGQSGMQRQLEAAVAKKSPTGADMFDDGDPDALAKETARRDAPVPNNAGAAGADVYKRMKRSTLLSIARMKGINVRGKSNDEIAEAIHADDEAKAKTLNPSGVGRQLDTPDAKGDGKVMTATDTRPISGIDLSDPDRWSRPEVKYRFEEAARNESYGFGGSTTLTRDERKAMGEAVAEFSRLTSWDDPAKLDAAARKIQAFRDMDAERKADFVASRKRLSEAIKAAGLVDNDEAVKAELKQFKKANGIPGDATIKKLPAGKRHLAEQVLWAARQAAQTRVAAENNRRQGEALRAELARTDLHPRTRGEVQKLLNNLDHMASPRSVATYDAERDAKLSVWNAVKQAETEGVEPGRIGGYDFEVSYDGLTQEQAETLTIFGREGGVALAERAAAILRGRGSAPKA